VSEDFERQGNWLALAEWSDELLAVDPVAPIFSPTAIVHGLAGDDPQRATLQTS
jgi:hypothetical protein